VRLSAPRVTWRPGCNLADGIRFQARWRLVPPWSRIEPPQIARRGTSNTSGNTGATMSSDGQSGYIMFDVGAACPGSAGYEAAMSDLSSQHCVPCRGGVPPLSPAEIAELLVELAEGWEAVDNHHLTKTVVFPNFASGLAYVNGVGAVAEAEHHHPDIYLAWGKVRIDIWTHKIDGLTLSDFVLAAKCEDLLPE
jgi:4a-hydroxytetrahydrobiopterin dehydratase